MSQRIETGVPSLRVSEGSGLPAAVVRGGRTRARAWIACAGLVGVLAPVGWAGDGLASGGGNGRASGDPVALNQPANQLANQLAVQPADEPAPNQPGRRRPPPTTPVPATPATPASPSTPTGPGSGTPAAEAPARPAPTLGDYVTPANRSKDWVLYVSVQLRSDTQAMRDGNNMPIITPFTWQTLGMIWPIAPRTAGSVVRDADVRGVLSIDGQEVTRQHRILGGYPAGARLARFDAGDGTRNLTAREILLTIEVPTTTRNVTFDEERAMRLRFPSTWPAEAASALRPQLWVETGINADGKVQTYDAAPLKDAVDRWLRAANIAKPSDAPVVRVAKALAAGVWGSTQVSGDGNTTTRNGEWAGLLIQPPVTTLRSGKGSPHDLAVLLCAAMRQAGLPARVVTAWDAGARGAGEGEFLRGSRKENKLRSWVEFALFDEAANTINWVPVDIERLRKSSSRAPGLDRPWRYFGSHNELENLVPIAVQFSPPTDVASYGAPAFWGWFVTPQPPAEAEQRVSFRASLAPRRGGEQDRSTKPDRNDEDEDDKRRPGRD